MRLRLISIEEVQQAVIALHIHTRFCKVSANTQRADKHKAKQRMIAHLLEAQFPKDRRW